VFSFSSQPLFPYVSAFFSGSVFGDVGWFSVTHLDGSDFGYHDAIFGALAYYSS
jgi:hypothetical protein